MLFPFGSPNTLGVGALCYVSFAELHLGPYQSIFGSFEIPRAVYGSREGQKIEFVPLDQRLGLPEGKFSYVLQDWDQSYAVESPYAEVDARLQKILGFPQAVDSLERMNGRWPNRSSTTGTLWSRRRLRKREN